MAARFPDNADKGPGSATIGAWFGRPMRVRSTPLKFPFFMDLGVGGDVDIHTLDFFIH